MDTLRVLNHQHAPVGLRQLARLADIHPHSAECMLKDLVHEGLVIRRNTHGRSLYSAAFDHPEWEVLRAVFDASDRAMRSLRARDLNERAQSILPFIEEARGMLARARGEIHVS